MWAPHVRTRVPVRGVDCSDPKGGSCIPWDPTSPREVHENVLIRSDLPLMCRGFFLYCCVVWGRIKPWGAWALKRTISTQLGRGRYNVDVACNLESSSIAVVAIDCRGEVVFACLKRVNTTIPFQARGWSYKLGHQFGIKPRRWFHLHWVTQRPILMRCYFLTWMSLGESGLSVLMC